MWKTETGSSLDRIANMITENSQTPVAVQEISAECKDFIEVQVYDGNETVHLTVIEFIVHKFDHMNRLVPVRFCHCKQTLPRR